MAASPAEDGDSKSRSLDIGSTCGLAHCKQRDFLPFACSACSGVFCLDHRQPSDHACAAVDVKAEAAAAAAAASATATAASSGSGVAVRANPHTFRCSVSGCSGREVVAIRCTGCKENYCVPHRFPSDHACRGTPRPPPPLVAFDTPLALLFVVPNGSGAASDASAIDACAGLMTSILKNILLNPNAAKYRSLNMNGLSAKLNLPGALNFLVVVGFVHDTKRNRYEFTGSVAQLTAGLMQLHRKHHLWTVAVDVARKTAIANAAAAAIAAIAPPPPQHQPVVAVVATPTASTEEPTPTESDALPPSAVDATPAPDDSAAVSERVIASEIEPLVPATATSSAAATSEPAALNPPVSRGGGGFMKALAAERRLPPPPPLAKSRCASCVVM